MRRLIYWLISIFYPLIEIEGAEKVPQSGGMIVISNHPNGIIDPVPLMIKLERPISFLAKSTLWGIPIISSFVKLFNAIPIYRHKDDGKWFGPKGDVAERNEASFQKAGKHLRDGGILALFPEGVTHSGSQLLPLKTGAARIALLNEAESDWSGDIPIVPIGLWYEHKSRFRSSVLLVVGEPFTLEDYREGYEKDERETVRQLTEKLDESLDEVVLQAESHEILRTLPLVVNLLNKGRSKLESQHTQMQSLLSAYTKLKQQNPARLNKIVDAMRQYDQLGRSLGLRNPWQPDLPPVSWGHLISRFAGLTLITPFAALGLLIFYIPYRLSGFIAEKAILGDDTQLSLAKIVGGVLFLLVTWFGLSIWIWNQLGNMYGVIVFIALPLLAFSTMVWFETLQAIAYRLTHSGWLRSREEVRAFIDKHQNDVSKLISDALQEYA